MGAEQGNALPEELYSFHSAQCNLTGRRINSLPSVTSLARAFAGLLQPISYLLFCRSQAGAASSSCCIITYLILPKELNLRVERGKQINNLKAQTHPSPSSAAASPPGPRQALGPSGSPQPGAAGGEPGLCGEPGGEPAPRGRLRARGGGSHAAASPSDGKARRQSSCAAARGPARRPRGFSPQAEPAAPHGAVSARCPATGRCLVQRAGKK